VIIGTTYGVNMLEELKNDKRLWVNTSVAYNGFLFQPSKGWLSNADTTITTTEYNRHTNKEQSSVFGNTKATDNVCT